MVSDARASASAIEPAVGTGAFTGDDVDVAGFVPGDGAALLAGAAEVSRGLVLELWPSLDATGAAGAPDGLVGTPSFVGTPSLAGAGLDGALGLFGAVGVGAAVGGAAGRGAPPAAGADGWAGEVGRGAAGWPAAPCRSRVTGVPGRVGAAGAGRCGAPWEGDPDVCGWPCVCGRDPGCVGGGEAADGLPLD